MRPMEAELSLCHVQKWLAKDGPVYLAMREMPTIELDVIARPGASSLMSHQIILSFAFIVFGIQQGQASIAHKGWALYGKALTRLNGALSDPTGYARDEVCVSVIALTCLEMLAPTSPENRIRHIVGLERILDLRGPHAYCSDEHFDVLNCTTILMFDASLHTAKPSILAKPEWKTVMWARCSDEDALKQELHDLIADCTVLGAERNAIAGMSSRNTSHLGHTRQRDALEHKALDLRAQFFAWKQRWDRNPGNSPIVSEPLRENQELSRYGFLIEPAAAIYMAFHTALIFVHRLLATIPEEMIGTRSAEPSNEEYPVQTARLSGTAQTRKDGYRAAEQLAAVEISRCIPYNSNLAATAQSGTSSAFAWAVLNAWETVGGSASAEGRRMLDLLRANGGEDTATLLEVHSPALASA